MPNGTTTTLVTSAGEADAIELWPVYAEVFGDRDHAAWQRTVWDRHVATRRFPPGKGVRRRRHGRVRVRVHRRPGQWWTDRMAAVWPAELAATWLGGHFELVSTGVLPRARRAGLARG